ncbi:hypothetical protein A9Q99_12885 [Gammaproteobacteria bacterium 45_16_T64]|nr:hypothetical protein A9Q99_12885 [Gammaproteobacteria bacterium 45_16_T64]
MNEQTLENGKEAPYYLAPKLASMANAALNGAIGDTLEKREHSLTVKPGFYYRGHPIGNANTVTTPGSAASKKLTIFLHGACCNEHIWEFSPKTIDLESSDLDPTDYGTLIHSALGYRPFYYRYNSGLSIAKNGELFAEHLDQLLGELTVDVEEIILIGYSMGGLVQKSAMAWASKHNNTFLPLIKQAFYLGTPHHGAPLEKIAKIAHMVLDRLPFPITTLVSNIMNGRSQGIKDLGFGDVTPYPNAYWVKDVEHHFIGGTLSANESNPISFFLGDLLVRQLSAMPIKEQGYFSEQGIQYQYRLFPGVNHVQLQRNNGVLNYIQQNLQAAA